MGGNNNVLKSRVIKQGKVDWCNLEFIQSGSFKELPEAQRVKLKQSMLINSFVDPFKVWEDRKEGKIYCLDGKHRTDILNELVKDGYSVPKTLPADFIDCADIEEAAKLVLIYSSHYATITQDGLNEFLTVYHLPIELLTTELSFPNLPSLLDMPSIEATPAQIEPDMFFINIECADESECNKLYERFMDEGFKVKIIR